MELNRDWLIITQASRARRSGDRLACGVVIAELVL
jgi:hypothetical protein